MQTYTFRAGQDGHALGTMQLVPLFLFLAADLVHQVVTGTSRYSCGSTITRAVFQWPGP